MSDSGNIFMMRPAAVVILLLLMDDGLHVNAVERPAPLSRRGTDLVGLRKEHPLLGVVLNHRKDGSVKLATQRAWLRSSHPQRYQQHAARERIIEEKRIAEMESRIESWIRRRPQDANLTAFLRDELRRLRKESESLRNPNADVSRSQFIVIEVPAEQIRRVYIQPANRKRIALVAWRERLADVETRSARKLLAELEGRGVQVNQQQTVNLSLADRIPPAVQNDRQWAARIALVEHRYRDPVEFQGIGEVLFRADDKTKQTATPEVFAELLRQRLMSVVGDLVEPGIQKRVSSTTQRSIVTKAAVTAGATGVRVTTVDHDLSTRAVTVKSRFFARMPNGDWTSIWQAETTVRTEQASPETERRIRDDRQIKTLLTTIEGLGIGTGEINVAIRSGAATMTAQKDVDARFLGFLEQYLHRLDQPPLRVPARDSR